MQISTESIRRHARSRCVLAEKWQWIQLLTLPLEIQRYDSLLEHCVCLWVRRLRPFNHAYRSSWSWVVVHSKVVVLGVWRAVHLLAACMLQGKFSMLQVFLRTSDHKVRCRGILRRKEIFVNSTPTTYTQNENYIHITQNCGKI